MGRSPSTASQPHFSSFQIIGLCLMCAVSLVYLYYIVFMYSDSKPESKERLKQQVKKRISIIPLKGHQNHEVRHEAPMHDHQSELIGQGRDRVKSIVDTMTESNGDGDNVVLSPFAPLYTNDNNVSSAQLSTFSNDGHESEENSKKLSAIFNPMLFEQIDSPPLQDTSEELVGLPDVLDPQIFTKEKISAIDDILSGVVESSSLAALQSDSSAASLASPTKPTAPSPFPFSSPSPSSLSYTVEASSSTALSLVPPATGPLGAASRSQSMLMPVGPSTIARTVPQIMDPFAAARIRVVDFSGQELKADSITILAKVLMGQFVSVTDIGLRSCELRDFEAALIARALIRNKTVVNLDLSGNKIGKDGCAVLASAFGETDVQEGSRGGSAGAGTPKGATTQRPFTKPKQRICNVTLVNLNLSGNRIGAAGATTLSKALQGNKSLVCLDVSYQRKGFKIGAEGAHKFADLLGSKSCPLLTFRCARNNIGFEGCRHISSALFRNTTLTELDIGGVNYITIAGALQLGQAIRRNKLSKLAWLTVGEHRIPVESIIGLNQPRTDCPTLTSSIRIFRTETDAEVQYRNKAFVTTSRHGMDDELGVVVATLLTQNRHLQSLQVDAAVLPVQKLIGNDRVSYLDLSSMQLTTIDAIIIGSLVAENTYLRKINLRDNCFGGTEGENFVAYALERNVRLKLDTTAWSAAQMFSDGYPALAATQGMSASGVTIEPQRLEGWFYQGLTAWSAMLFYLGLAFDIGTLVIFSNQPNIYFGGWVVLLAVIMCTPTAVYLFNVLRNMLFNNPREAIIQSILILLQVKPAVYAYEAIAASMESAAMLDYKFVQSTHKSIPQIYFQSFIMFAVAIHSGDFSFWPLVSVMTSLLSITVIFIMLFDRKAARRMSMAPPSDQPQCAVVVAKIFELFGMGHSSEEVKAFVNFDAFYTSHYCLSYVYQLVGLCPRIVSITWLLACEDSMYGIVTLFVAFWVRIIILCLHDNETYDRSFFNNSIMAISLVISDSAWHIDPSDGERSREAVVNLTFISTSEILIALFYVYFVFDRSVVSHSISTAIFGLMIFFILIRWLMLFGWTLHVHFPRLYVKTKRSSIHLDEETSMVSGLVEFGWNVFGKLHLNPHGHHHPPVSGKETKYKRQEFDDNCDVTVTDV